MAPLSLYISFYTSVAKAVFTLIFARLYNPQRPPHRNLKGQNAVVTGANSGIGLSIATALAKQGATVHLACRNIERGNTAVASIVSQLGSEAETRVFCWKADVGDLHSVRAFCEKWKETGMKIDMLVHNAGIPEHSVGTRKNDEKGRDIVLVTNFLGSFLMTCSLEKYLSEKGRVVLTSSAAHYSVLGLVMRTRPQDVVPKTAGDDGGVARGLLQKLKVYLGVDTRTLYSYGLSKAYQVLFAALLQRRFDSMHVNQRTTYAFSPGFTSTPLFAKFAMSWKTWFSNPAFALLKVTEKYVAVDAYEGAKTGSWLASCGGEQGIEGGGYWEWMSRKMSLIDLVERELGDEG